MSIFSFFRPTKPSPAAQAKERLQIVMAHERAGRTGPDYLPMLQQELLSVIAKYINIDENKVEVKLDRGGDCSTLELNIELPTGTTVSVGSGNGARMPVNGNGRPVASASPPGTTSSQAPPQGLGIGGGANGDMKPGAPVKAVASVLTTGGIKGKA